MTQTHEPRDAAARFARDVDRIMSGESVVSEPDDALAEDLAFVRALSQAQFVPEPGFEARLRSRLFAQAFHKEASMRADLRSWLRPLLAKAAIVAVAVCLLVTVSLVASPGARAAARGWLAQFVEVDAPAAALPTASMAMPASAPGELNAPPQGGDALTLPPVTAPATALVSLSEAQSKVSFTIRAPAQLPDGYKLVGAALPPALPADAPAVKVPEGLPAVAPPQLVSLFFESAAGDKLILSQARLAQIPGGATSLPAGKGSVRELTVGDQPAQYIEGGWARDGWMAQGSHVLHWQDADGVTYDLISTTLDQAGLQAVAESIK